MTKHGGRYYLQYGAPGTEYNVYANGTYVVGQPARALHLRALQSGRVQAWRLRPRRGTRQHLRGRVRQLVEHGHAVDRLELDLRAAHRAAPGEVRRRRPVLSSSRFGDFPHYMPTASQCPGQPVHRLDVVVVPQAGDRVLDHGRVLRQQVTDENPHTFWVAASNTPGQTLTVDLGRIDTVRAVQVNYADYKSGRFADAPISTPLHARTLARRHLGRRSRAPSLRARDRPNAYFELPQPVRARFVRYVHGHVGAAHLAISDIRVFGNGVAASPATPTRLSASRHRDQRDATIRWAACPARSATTCALASARTG